MVVYTNTHAGSTGHSAHAPKYSRLVSLLEGQLRAGSYAPGDRLPSERELCDRYDLARGTVRQAIGELESQGLVERRRGHGTVVLEPPVALTPNRVIGLVVQTNGHVHQDFAAALVRGVQAAGHSPMLLDAGGAGDPAALLASLDRLLAMRPSALVVEGDGCIPPAFYLRPELPPLVVTGSQHPEHCRHLPAGIRILSDIEHGNYIAMRHLLERGHVRVCLFVHAYTHPDIIAGARRGMAEAGLDPDRELSLLQESTDEARDRAALHRLAARSDSPTAYVATYGDYRARSVYELARERGLHIPSDLAVVGFNNTPWCTAYSPALTSVSIREAEIARLAVAAALGQLQESAWVQPELIVRESTGGPHAI